MNSYLKSFLNLTLLGISIGILIGSLFRAINLEEDKTAKKFVDQSISQSKKSKISKYKLSAHNNEIIELSSKWKELASKSKDLEASAYIIFLDTNQFAEFSPNRTLPAASTIKIPLLLLALDLIDKGELLLNEPIELEKELIAGGAGWIAYEPVGKSFPVYELITEMIRISDNTATNLIIKRLGGIDSINKKLSKLGLENTKINNLLPDLKGTNLTSVKDLTLAISLVDSGNFLTARSRDLFRETLSTSTSNKLLPEGLLKGLGERNGNIDYKLLIKGYRVYNKTGDIGIAYADAGLIQMPNNTRAIASFIVKGPFNDPRSSELIREMSKAIVEIIKPKTIFHQNS